MRNRKAYTLIEVSIALLILNTVVLLWLYLFNALNHFDAKIVERENRIGLIQLRRMISLGKDIKIDYDQLCMNFRDDDVCFYETNHHLIQTPGTQIYLLEVEEIEFEEREDVFVLTYYQEDNVFEYIIGYR